MMRGRKLLPFVSPTACAICLAAGFAAAGRWTALAAVVIVALAWLAAARWRFAFLPHTALMLSVGLAAAGLLLDVPAAWMILGAACALAAWDVILFQRFTAGTSEAGQLRRLELSHYRSLMLALGVGLAASVAGPLLRIRISFWWMMLLTTLALASLEGLRRLLEEKGVENRR